MPEAGAAELLTLKHLDVSQESPQVLFLNNLRWYKHNETDMQESPLTLVTKPWRTPRPASVAANSATTLPSPPPLPPPSQPQLPLYFYFLLLSSWYNWLLEPTIYQGGVSSTTFPTTLAFVLLLCASVILIWLAILANKFEYFMGSVSLDHWRLKYTALKNCLYGLTIKANQWRTIWRSLPTICVHTDV